MKLWKRRADGAVDLKELDQGMFSSVDNFREAVDYWLSEGWTEERPTRLTPREIFANSYEGFESVYDLERDISEMFEGSKIPGEFQGRLVVTVTYIPSEDDPS